MFCYLSQGKDYFQPYEYLYEALGNKNTESDKKTVEQLAFHLRRDLSKSIPILNIETIWAKGYQIKGKDEMEIRIERIENKEV